VPDYLARLVKGAVEMGVFQNKSDAMLHALREYFKENLNWVERTRSTTSASFSSLRT